MYDLFLFFPIKQKSVRPTTIQLSVRALKEGNENEYK